MPSFHDRVTGALCGVAIGDGMGAPVEGWAPEKIAGRFDHARAFFPKTGGGDPATGKGDGRFTDDTLMTEALIRAYAARGDHMDAYDFEQFFLKEIAETLVWLPERQKEMPILSRLWIPEQYPWKRMAEQKVEPRLAGQGNTINCGLAMYMMPVGAVNAGDPRGAYQEAAAFGLAHNESFALEAGAVMAAAYAQAFDATAVDAVLECALSLARDGTGRAIRSVLESVDAAAPLTEFIRRTRAAVLPFDSQPGLFTDDQADTGKRVAPSRALSIEELPVALAALKYGNGDFYKTLQAGVFYGRDCDSIAGMATGLYGALFGVARIPQDLRKASESANRRDYGALVGQLAEAAELIRRKDAERWTRHLAAMSAELTKHDVHPKSERKGTHEQVDSTVIKSDGDSRAID